MEYLLVEKKNHNAVHGLFYSYESAVKFLSDTVPLYIERGYYMDKTLTVNNFEVIKNEKSKL